MSSGKAMEDYVNKEIETFVTSIIKKLKTTHEKFVDVDFGPTEDDEFGAVSFYGNVSPEPAGSKYPKPEQLRWERPLYEDKLGEGEKKDNIEEEEFDEFALSVDKDDEVEVDQILLL